jgi:hypothetical protein
VRVGLYFDRVTIGGRTLGLCLAPLVLALPSPARAADPGITWASLPAPELPNEFLMEPRGVWTQSGTQYGYDGKVLFKLPGKRGWAGLRIATIGSSIAIAGGEVRPVPRDFDGDVTFELPTTALYDAAGNAVWTQRWSRKPVERQQMTFQVLPGPDGDVFVAGHYWGCTTFGAPGKKHCPKEVDGEFPSSSCGDDIGCPEPFRLQYDQTGQLKEARTFPGTYGNPTLGPGGELAIVTDFDKAIDIPTGKRPVHFEPGLPGTPDARPQALVLRYDAQGSWKWGRAFVGERTLAMENAVFTNDGTLWAFLGAAKTSVLGPAPIMVVGGKKPRPLMDDPGTCGALVAIDDKGNASLRQKACSDGSFGVAPLAKLFPARTSGLFAVLPREVAGMLDAAALPAPRTTVVADVGPPQKNNPSRKTVAVIWYRGDRVVWGMRAPADVWIRGAYDPSDGRVCVLFGIEDRRTWQVGGARFTVGEAKKKTTQVGCFPVSVPP